VKLTPIADLGGSYQEVYPATDGSGDIFTCSGGAIQRVDNEMRLRWSSKPIGAHWIATVEDLDADGRQEILTSNGRTVFILSAIDGRILWSYDVGPPFSYGTYATMFQIERMIPDSRGKQFTVPCFSHKEVLLFDCSEGAERTKLAHSLWMNDAYHPTTVIGDVNGDGNVEIVIARLGGVYVFDPLSGKMLSSTQWNSDEQRRRNYGHFELADTDGTGILNAVILSDRVTRHVALLENDGKGHFTPRWDRFIEHIYPNDSTELRYCFGSVTGLSSRNITFSTYNSTTPGHWCTEVVDPRSGRATELIDDEWLAGVSGDRLFLQHAPSRAVSEFSNISIADENDNVFADEEHSQFAKRTVHYRGTKGQFKPEVFGQDDIWLARNKPLIISNQDDSYQLRAFSTLGTSEWFLESDEPFRIAAIIDDAPIVSARSGELLTMDGHSIKLGYHLTTEAHLSARPGIRATESPKGIITPRFNNIVLVQGKQIAGRGRIGYDNVYHDVPLVSTGSGTCLIVLDDEGLEHARLKVYTTEGSLVNTIDLPHLPPSKYGFRIGVYDWRYFQHSRGEALYLAAYRSPSMNSECSLAVLLDTSEILWETTSYGSGEFGRGIGPWGSSTLTRINDRQCVIFCAKDTLVVLDLEDGSFIREPLLLTDLTKAEMQRQGIFKEQGFDTWSTIEDPFTAYGSVIPKDINNDGLEEYLIAGCFGGFGLLDDQFTPLWWKISPFGDVLYRMPAITDLDHDGKLEVYQSHADSSIRAYEASSGALLASVQLEGNATDLTATGQDLIATTNFGKTYRIGWQDGILSILETVDSSAALGSPMLTQSGQILIASAEGTLFSLSR
jgi:outer membrane protein assembly factor BamB